MARELTKKEQGFIKDMVITDNATQSALNNYDIKSKNKENVAGMIGSEIIRKPKIRQAMALIKKERKSLSPEEIKFRDSIIDSVMDKMEIEELIPNDEDFWGYIYVMNCKDFYKIGITDDLNNRLNQIQTGNPYPISLVLGIKHKMYKEIEKKLHKIFIEKIVRREWFKLEDGDILFIRSFIENYEYAQTE